MNKEQFEKVCRQATSGKATFVANPESGEDGRVVSCINEEVVVFTGMGSRRSWNYHDCSETNGFGRG